MLNKSDPSYESSQKDSAIRERGIQKLFAAIDFSIRRKLLNPRSQIADARLDLGEPMSEEEAIKILFPK